jgi:serine/threonine-protein kinase
MGIVYRAVDTKLGREVAIKVLPAAFANDPSRMARLTREARVLAALNHPNIAAIYGVEDGALVMELVEGETLSGPLPLKTALDYARQIADALDCAHEKGIVHRDLKPGNIKVTPGGVVKVLDFGLAKAGEPASAMSEDSTLAMDETRPGAVMGTMGYMAPEQARGKPVDKRADIWAFGVVLYELLTGHRLFQAETASDTIAAVLTREIDFQTVLEPVRRLLRRCLERDPQQRLRDIGDFELLLAETPAIAAPRRWPYGLAISILAAALLVLVFLPRRAAENPPHPLLQFRVDLGPDALPAGGGTHIALSPDGARLAYFVRSGDGPVQIATRLLDQSTGAMLVGSEGADGNSGIFFSPDSQWLGFFAGGKLKKVSIQGGPVSTICHAPGPRGAWWGPNGYIVTTLNLAGGLFRVPENGGTPQPLTDPSKTDEATHRWPQVLPGGEAVLFTGNRFTGDYTGADIDVLSLKTGHWKIVQRGGSYGRYVSTGHLLYVSHSTLYAVLFDLTRLQVHGSPVPLLNDVAERTNSGNGQFDAGNGMLVYFSTLSMPSKWPVAWIDATGRQESIPLPPARYFSPRLSPDGNKLAIAAEPLATGSDIEIYDFLRDTTTRLTFTGNDSRPIWAPDGKHILYVSALPRALAIRWARADGVGETRTLFASRKELQLGNFSPGGRRLVFSEIGYGAWTLPLDLSDPDNPKPGQAEPFAITRSTEFEPSFSPDGRWIAYAAADRAGGDFDIFVRPFPPPGGSRSPEWQISTDRGALPVWSRNGRELFYVGPGAQILVVPYTVEDGSFVAGKPRVWCGKPLPEMVRNGNTWPFDLAPDGTRFVILPMPKGAQETSAHITVLLNFFDELRRRVPVR